MDNCYGEFTQTREPLAVGADLIAGSFIKNPGGGITPTGGYIAGRADLVEKCSHRFTAPGIGADLGCTQDSLRDTFLGFYYAPGVVCEALKTAIYAQCLLELAGVHPVPRYTADHNDIVTCFDSGSAAALTGFCAGIQHNSPVDSFASPEPADEPGYTDKVVMASGSFTEGSTIEISCDGPLRPALHLLSAGGCQFYRRPCRGTQCRAERLLCLKIKNPVCCVKHTGFLFLKSAFDVVADQGLQQIVTVNAADDRTGILIGGNVGGILREDVPYQLVDGVVALLFQRAINLQHCLFDLHIAIIADREYSSRLRDRHIQFPFLSVISPIL